MNSSFTSHEGKKTQDHSKLQDTKGVKLYYIGNLTIVGELRSQLFETQNQLFLKCNLVNLMAFYGMLECSFNEENGQTVY